MRSLVELFTAVRPGEPSRFRFDDAAALNIGEWEFVVAVVSGSPRVQRRGWGILLLEKIEHEAEVRQRGERREREKGREEGKGGEAGSREQGRAAGQGGVGFYLTSMGTCPNT